LGFFGTRELFADVGPEFFNYIFALHLLENNTEIHIKLLNIGILGSTPILMSPEILGQVPENIQVSSFSNKDINL
jgi:hypothetical protein